MAKTKQFKEVMYVAGPYRAETINEITENIQNARKVATILWKAGFAVICPHMNSAFMDGACEDETFLAGGLELVRRSDGLVLIGNWRESEGTLAELKFAQKLGKSILIHTDEGFTPFTREAI